MRILRALLLFISITASISVEATMHSCSSPLIVFGFEQSDMRCLMSSLELGFENNRKVLGQLMKSMDFTVTLMDAVDIQTPKLRGIHDTFRSQAMKIPILWEKNEVLLRYLVSPQKMLITYAISHNQMSDLHRHHGVREDSNACKDLLNSELTDEGSREPLESTKRGKGRKENKVPPPSYENLEQILVHLCRDWSAQGKVIRKRLYTDGIISKMLQNLPVNSNDHWSTDGSNEQPYTVENIPSNQLISFNTKTDVIDVDSIQNSSEIANDLISVGGREQNAKLYCNCRRTFHEPHYAAFLSDNEIVCACLKDNSTESINFSRYTSSSSVEPKSLNRIKIINKNMEKNKEKEKNKDKNKNENENENNSKSFRRNSQGVRVLVPGAGLGRLASELAALGYAVEANDCSGIMVAAMRTILEDILPFMNTDTGGNNNDDNDNGNENDDKDDKKNKNENEYDDGNESDYNTLNKSKTDRHDNTNPHSGTHIKSGMDTDNANANDVHSIKETMRGRDKDDIKSSHNIQNKTAQSFEFYPHISPKLADNWDFEATLEAVTFPSSDSMNVAKWLKKRRKQNVLKNCVDGIPVSEGDDASHTSNTEQSEENDKNAVSDDDRSDDTAMTQGNNSPVLDPLLASKTAPPPIPAPAPFPDPFTVPTLIPISTSTPHSAPTPVPTTTPDKPSVDPLGSLAIQMGDFTKIYGHIDQENQFDCVVTCFFIDTASDILEYLAVIAHVLREGGVWVNAGPLHYHLLSTIQYSYAQIIEVVKVSGFEVVSQDTVRTTSYSGEDAFSMKPEYYTVPLDVFRLVRKEDRWPIDGHHKPNMSISDRHPKTSTTSSRDNLSQTPHNKEKKLADDFHDDDENFKTSDPWIRTNFVIKK